MSFGTPAPESQQPGNFEFSAENLARARAIIAKYPDGRQQSALLPLLDLAQRQHENWLPRAAMDHVADLLRIPPIRAYEVASFYTMFNRAPVGTQLIQVCTTTPCWLCGSSELLRAIKEKTGLAPGDSSADGRFTVVEVECLGACVNAPMVQVNDDYYEDLDHKRMGELIDALGRGEAPPSGSQIGRRGSQALSGPTTLLDSQPAAGPPPKAAAETEVAEEAVEIEPDVAEAERETAEEVPALEADADEDETEPAEEAVEIESDAAESEPGEVDAGGDEPVEDIAEGEADTARDKG